jgi:hypothetical protein
MFGSVLWLQLCAKCTRFVKNNIGVGVFRVKR